MVNDWLPAIHKVIWVNGKERYLCNQACNITKSKTTKQWAHVTCKNCLREIERGIETYEE